MSLETLPGYDAWKTSGPPDSGDDYERGLEYYAPDAGAFCEAGHESCDRAVWGGADGEEFAGCELGVTDRSFAVVGSGEDCLAVRRKAEDFDAKEYDMGL